MEREKHKELLARKLSEKDPSVYLVKPEKSSKSCAWSADCFSLIFNNNVKENYVYCQICSNLITYNSVHGTGSLLRHHCYKKVMNMQKQSGDQKPLIASTPKIHKKLPNDSNENETENNSISNILLTTPDSIRFQAKCRDNTKQKKDIEKMIANGDPSIDMRPPANIKSDVWSNGNFKIVYRDGNKLDFVLCLFCHSLITYKSKTGTASLLRHSCIKKLNAAVKSECESPHHTDSIHEFITIPMEQVDDVDTVGTSGGGGDSASFTNETESDQVQYLANEFVDEFKDEASKLFQYFSYKDMQPQNLSQKRGFLSFGQYLINIGAEYGKVNIESILEGKHIANTMLEDNFMNILQKILKAKFEDNKIILSCDFWTDPNRKLNFFTLYGHYISESFEMKKLNLRTVNFTEEFSTIDYKQLIHSILEDYLNGTSIETFLSRTTTVIFDEMIDCFKPYSTINCACLTLNRIVQQLIDECNFRDLIPHDILSTDNWYNVWEYLEAISDSANADAIEELKQILDPFTKAVKNLSYDQKPTINEVYIFRKKIEDHFRNTDFTNVKVRDLALNLIKENFPMTNLHKVAVFLDPRFKSLKFMSHEEKANVLSMVSKMLNTDDTDNNGGAITIGDGNVQKIHTTRTNNDSITSDTAESTKYLIEYMDITEERDENHDEVELYVNLKYNDIYSSNILEFWESRYDLPHLQQLAREILCIPASGIVTEKIFTEDASLLAKRRLNVELDNIKQILYIHENFELLSNVL